MNSYWSNSATAASPKDQHPDAIFGVRQLLPGQISLNKLSGFSPSMISTSEDITPKLKWIANVAR